MIHLSSALILFLSLQLSHGQSSGIEIFEKDGRFGFRDSLGAEVVPAVYDDLGWTNDEPVASEVFGYSENHRWGLMNSRGKKLTEPTYYGVYPFESEGLYKVGVTGKFTNDLRFGLVDERGKLALSCHYFSLESSKGNIIASLYQNHQVRYGVLGADYNVKIPLEFLEIRQVGPIFMGRDIKRKWSFFNAQGQPIVDGAFDRYAEFGDYLLIEKKGARGVINWRNQSLVFLPRYKQVNFGPELSVEEPKTWSVYNRDLKLVMEVKGDSISQLGELLVVYLNGAQRLFADSTELLPEEDFAVEYSGKDITIVQRMTDDRWLAVERGEAIFEGDSIYFDGNYFYIQESDEWTIYNKFRRRLNDYPLEDVAHAVELYVPAKRAGQWGLLDYQGKTIIGFAYDSLNVGIDLTFPANYVGSWGVLDVFGDWVISPAYEQLVQITDLYVGTKRGVNHVLTMGGARCYQSRYDLALGNASVVIDAGDRLGLISSEGEVIFDPVYTQVTHMGEYYAGRLEEGMVVKDGKGDFVLTVDHGVEEVAGESEGYIQIVKNGMHGFVDLQGRLRVANRYDSARMFSEGMAAIKLIGKWGFINEDERLVVQPYYQWVSDFSDGLAIVNNGKYGLVDRYGDLKFELDYKNIERTSAGSYIITNNLGKHGLASAGGSLVLSPSYDVMDDIGTGYIVVARNDKKGIYDHGGNLLVSFVHDEIVALPSYILMR